MSVHTVYRCDACPVPVDGEVERDHKVWLHLDRQMDGAGSMEDVGEEIHLCHACCIAILTAVTKAPVGSACSWWTPGTTSQANGAPGTTSQANGALGPIDPAGLLKWCSKRRKV